MTITIIMMMVMLKPNHSVFKSPKEYLEDYINPPEFIEEQRQKRNDQNKKYLFRENTPKSATRCTKISN